MCRVYENKFAQPYARVHAIISRTDSRRSLVDRWSRIEVGTRSSVKRSRLPSQVRFHLARTYLRNLYSHARTVSSNRRCTIGYLNIQIHAGCTYYWDARNVSQPEHPNVLVGIIRLSATFLLVFVIRPISLTTSKPDKLFTQRWIYTETNETSSDL